MSNSQIPNCVCGCAYEQHLWNINQNSEGEADWEELSCRSCTQWIASGDFSTNCEEYRPSEESPIFEKFV